MDKCPFCAHIDVTRCKECADSCGFNPKEMLKRIRKIAKGRGLTPDENGLRHLVIKRKE